MTYAQRNEMQNQNPTWQNLKDCVASYNLEEDFESKSMWENVKDYVKECIPGGNIKSPESADKFTPEGERKGFFKRYKKKAKKFLIKAGFVVGMVAVGAAIVATVSPFSVSILIVIALGLVCIVPLYFL